MVIAKTLVKLPSEFKPLFDSWWRHAVIEGGRYSLKSHTVARFLLLTARSKRVRIACLRQFQKNIADSSYQLLIDLIQQYGFLEFVWTNDTITNTNTGSTFIFKGLDRNVETTIKSLEGIDIAWIDEAQTITLKSIRILNPTIRKPGSKIIWTLNRLTDLDPVISYFITNPPRKDVWHLEVDYRIAQKNGWLSNEILYEIEQARINHPEDYAHDYLGKALSISDKNIIQTAQVIEAMGREVDDEGAIEVGVDVARLGGDRTVFVKRKGLKEIGRASFTKKRTTEVCDLLVNFIGADKDVLIKIDDTGVGGGVTDEMIARGYNVIPINFGAKASNPDKYPNLISEAWFYLQSIIDNISIANDKDLLVELSNREWKMDSKGRRGVESKDDYKKRGFRSPDLADATILCFYTPPEPPKIEYGGVIIG
jgi:phage terminase, large subunit, PBSX family|nr:MAG TPA: large terminase [Caudoviricetes sp.]